MGISTYTISIGWVYGAEDTVAAKKGKFLACVMLLP